MEKETEVKTIEVHYECLHCAGTNMMFIGRVQPTSPPKHLHLCPKCTNGEWLDKKYPYIKYIPVP